MDYKETILIVDDSAQNRMVLIEILGKVFYTRLEAENGQQAVELLDCHPEVDLLLLCRRMLRFLWRWCCFDAWRVSTAVLGIVLMWFSVTQLGIPWTLGGAVLLMISVAGTVLLLLGLFLVEATLCFLSVQSIEAVNILTFGGRTACEYPVDIYPRPIRLLFMYVAPFGLCMHVPVSALLHHPMVDWPAWTAYLAPLAGAMFFLLMALVWRKVGVRRYCSTGS